MLENKPSQSIMTELLGQSLYGVYKEIVAEFIKADRSRK